MKFGFALALLLLAIAAGVEYFAQRRRVDTLCPQARELGRGSGTVSGWLVEVAADPYLGDAALRGPPLALLELYREKSREIGADWNTHFLPEVVVHAFRDFGLTRGTNPDAVSALRALGPAVARLECRPVAGGEGSGIARPLAQAAAALADRRAAEVEDKREFARDRAIFCHGEELLHKLRGVVASAAAKCKVAAPGSKLSRACVSRAGNVTGGVTSEIEDLERQKELNLRKLRQKWPAAVVAGLRC